MSTFSLDKYVGKVAVVTGAASGIGKAITKALAKSGIMVAALDRQGVRLEDLAKDLNGEGAKVHPFKCDLSRKDEILETFEQITSQMGPIHVLVNNAGLSFNTNIIDGDIEIWKAILDVNLLAVAICCREAIRSMKEHNITGHIINTNSILGHQVSDHPGLSLYPTSKFGITGLTETLRLEINREKLPIKITSISPGYVRTEFYHKNLGVPEEVADSMPGLEPLDLANAAVYVLSTPDHVNIKELTLSVQGHLV